MLPLPTNNFKERLFSKPGLSRSVKRRILSKQHEDEWLDDGLKSINQLFGSYNEVNGLISNNQFERVFDLGKAYAEARRGPQQQLLT